MLSNLAKHIEFNNQNVDSGTLLHQCSTIVSLTFFCLVASKGFLETILSYFQKPKAFEIEVHEVRSDPPPVVVESAPISPAPVAQEPDILVQWNQTLELVEYENAGT